MAVLTKTYTFVADADAVAAEVNTNFDEIVAFVNDDVAHLDGAAFTGAVLLPGTAPTNDNHATRKAYVDDIVKGGQANGVTDANGDIFVTHGLGRVPVSAVVSITDTASAGPGTIIGLPFSLGATQFVIRFRYSATGAAASGVSLYFYWQAL
jgi:hypothetical protein